MKQLWQAISTGEASVVDVPAPMAGRGQILVRVLSSLISAGTERSVVEFADKNLLQKAMARPDLVRQLVAKGKREGWLSAIEAAKGRLDSDMVLGYSNSGVVIEIGEGVTEFKIGDRVACAGGGYASHSEIVRVPRNLAALIPVGAGGYEVPYEHAAFATVAAIGLQGIRLAELQLGEVVAVIGLGLIGQIVAQLARANGCTVIGMDLSAERCSLARRLGCIATATSNEELTSLVVRFSHGRGADCVLIAAATKNDGPVTLAAEVARDRARIVAIGDVGLHLPRKPYYMKELDFRVSRSYGAGRYDPEYEEKGRDYPIGYVRWTEGRNLQAVLELLSKRQVDFESLITHRFAIEDAASGYKLIAGKTGEPFLGVVISYPSEPSRNVRVELKRASVAPLPAPFVSLGLIGAGNFATATLLPAMKRAGGIKFTGICASGGTSARSNGARWGFDYCTSDEAELLNDPSINTVAICTRHADHAREVVAALDAGKHVFCEKPLALNTQELARIIRAYERQQGRSKLMVGYNRRFAPLAKQLKLSVSGATEPFVMHYRVNAGFIPRDHWVQDPEIGGGRIIGEVCHFVDFLSFICEQPVISVMAVMMDDAGKYANDNLCATIRFADGSIGTITYLSNGDKSFSKERIEVFVQGRVAVLDDFRKLETIQDGSRTVVKSRLRADKGHRGEWDQLRNSILVAGPSPIPLDQLVNSTLATFGILRSSAQDGAVEIRSHEFMHHVISLDDAGPLSTKDLSGSHL